MKKSYLLPVLSALSLGVSSNVAAVDVGQWYFSPNLSYIVADDDRLADDELGLQLGVGQVVDQQWNIELSAVIDTLDMNSGAGEYKQIGLLLDGLYFLDRDDSYDPYLVAGVAALQTKVPGSKGTNLMLNLGAGLQHRINDDISMRADIRYRLDDDDKSIATENRFGDWLVNIGLVIPFGGAQAAPMMAALSSDADGDGVIDANDRCLTTVAGASVDVNGCELDGDKDSVVDRLDRCPTTAAGIKVDGRGCELDSDNDGVFDSADSCPGSAAAASVDMKGCEIADVIVLKGVNFKSGSADLTEGSKVILDDVAQTLKKNADLVVELSGYTDNTGSKAFNVSLSQRRAQAVVDYLISQGVNGNNLTAKGYGPDNPIADNSTAAGRSENRRVEMHIVK